MTGNEATGTTAGRVYMFGGDGVTGMALNDLWSYSVATRLWSLLTPSSPTQSLYGRKLAAFSCGEGRCVLFGGMSTKLYNETWYFPEPMGTSTTVTWSKLSCSKSSPCPSPRYGSVMAFDPVRHYHVAFGGETQESRLGDTWTLSGTRWTPRSPLPSPPSRTNGSAAFVPSHVSNGASITLDKVVIFGGSYGWSADQAALCDLWAWNGSNWEAITAPTPKPCLAGAVIGWDASGARLVAAGGFTDAGWTSPNADTWTFTFTGSNSGVWSKATTTVCAPLRNARGAYDGSTKKFVFFGGLDYPTFYSDTLVCP